MRHPRTHVARLSCALLCLACASPLAAQKAPRASPLRSLGEDLILRALVPGVWMHVSFGGPQDGPTLPANGLLVTTGEMSLLIDTGWNESQSRRLLQWADETLGQPIEHVVITHSHPDRTGGLRPLLEQPIIVHSHAATAEAFRGDKEPLLHWSFEFEERLELGGEPVHLFYPGPGHSADNIVVWLPRRKILFGGCLIQGKGATELGYVADASLKRWPAAVRRVIERYRDAEILVPGHGQPGGVELLSHTMVLLEKQSFMKVAPR